MLKVALIGCGFFARNQIFAWRDIEGVELVAICDRDAERLARTGSEFGIERRYEDAAALFADGGFDIVDIATTVASHHALVSLAAQAGVHVICQKPFARSLAEAREMVEMVGKTGKLLMVHENFRWQSAVRRVIDLVREGAIGETFFGRISFRSGYDVYSGQPYLAEGERFIIEDLGIHLLDIARALFGDVTRIAATTRRINPAIRGEDVATMQLLHEGGATSVVDCSYATRRHEENFPQTLIEIDGEKGSLRLDAGYQLTLTNPDGAQAEDASPPLLAWAERPWHNIQESVLLVQQHFIDCLRAGQAPETSGQDNLQTFALVEAAYLSAREGRSVAPASL